jgi:CspA family cold shock protein
MTIGVVKFYKSEQGWGAISSPELPPGRDAFVHFSVIEGQSGFRAFATGDRVEFDFQQARQDSFDFVATRAQLVDDDASTTDASNINASE